MKPNWIITFTVNNIKGCAVAKADTANEAQSILTSSGMYNGTPSLYVINSIEQIFESPEPQLLCEQINDGL